MQRARFFISYARVDAEDRPYTKGSRLGELLADIGKDLGGTSERDDVQFLRDSTGVALVGNDLDLSIGAAINTCDLGLIFLSRAYCRSEECAKEFQQLLEGGKPMIMIELDEVWAMETGHLLSQFKSRTKRILTKRFWRQAGNKFPQFGYPTPGTCDGVKKKDYLNALEELVTELRIRINKEKLAKAILEPSTAVSNIDTRFDVLIASPTSDVKVYTDRLQDAFSKQGFSVGRVDHICADFTPDELGNFVTGGGIFVHILGALPGKPNFYGSGKQQVMCQHDIAIDAGLEILAWRSPEVGLLECDAGFQENVAQMSLQIISFEEFEQYAIKKVTQKVELLKQSDKREESEGLKLPPMIAVDAASEDRQIAGLISAELSKYVDVNQISYEDPDNAELSRAAKENNAILLVYGDTPNGQKRANTHFKLLRRLRWNAERRQLEIAVGDAGPDHAPPCPNGPDIHIIGIKDAVDPRALNKFLTSIGVVDTFLQESE